MDKTFYVLVPVYKTEKFLRDCIESVLNQTYQNFVLVLVDDGSPDNSGQICDEYADKDSRIIVIHKENGGLISARRAAINYVKQNFQCDDDYFLFLDSDDTFKLNAFEVINREINKNECDLLIFNYDRISYVKGKEQHNTYDGYCGSITDKRELYRTVFLNERYNPMCCKAIKCSLLDTDDYSRYYYISKGEDLLQSIPVYFNCQKATFIKDAVYNYMLNPDSITQNITCDSFNADSTVLRSIYEALKKSKVFNDDDMSDYIKRCLKALKRSVIVVSACKDSYLKKKKLYDAIREDSYYSQILTYENNDVVMKIFSRGHYRSLILYARLRRHLSKIYHLIKR